MPSPLPVFFHLPPSPRLTVPLGGPGTPAPIGTQLARGEALAPSRAVAPTAGTITAHTRAPLTDGRPADAIAIDVQPEPYAWPVDEPLPPEAREKALNAVRAATAADRPAWLARVAAAGIWADRRDCPDLAAQLKSPKPDTLLCSVLDSDPTLPLNHALSLRYGDALVLGAALLARVLGVSRSLVVVESRLAAARECRRAGTDLGLRFTEIRNDYPRSDPTLLLHDLLNRHLKPGLLPTDVGAVLVDAPAAVAVGLLLLRGLPMLRLPFAVRDHLRGKSHLLWLCPGTPLADVFSALQIPTDESTVRAGDVLRDLRSPPHAVVAAAELTAHLTAPVPPNNPDPCIRCSWCLEGCPTRVQPAALLEAAQLQDLAMAHRFGLDACIECGLCSYLCPSRLPLLHSIRQLKALDRAPYTAGALPRNP